MIELTVAGCNTPALVDDAFADLARYRWRINRDGYVFRHADGRIMLHHVVMGGPPAANLMRDHINRDKMDNRKSNLRWVTAAESNANRGANKSRGTGYRGVRFDPIRGRYLARIQRCGKAIVRQWFDDPADADAFLRRHRAALMPVSFEAA